MNFNEFFKELKRRNVFKGTVSYLVFAWVLLQVVAILSPIINAPIWVGKLILIVLIVFLPVWIFISWYYEVTADGIKKTKFVEQEKSITKKTGKKLNTFIIVFLILAISLLFVDRFRITSQLTDTVLTSTISQEKSIAVLPFRDMSPNGEQGYFADGLAEELLNALVKVEELKVTSRTSAFSFKDKGFSLPEIAAKLKVNYILEGSVRSQDSIIRISVKLIETKGDNNIWSQTWEKNVTNIFEVQNEIAQAVTKNLQLRLLDNIIPKVKESKTEAYALFLKGLYQYNKSSDNESLLEAGKLIKKSVKLDSLYAPSLILLGKIYHRQNNYGIISFEEGKKLTNKMVEKALKIDSTYADIYAFKALLALDYERNIKKANILANKALKLEPNNYSALKYAAEASLLLGNVENAIAIRKKALSLDPVNYAAYYSLANAFYFAEKYEEAEKYIKKCIELDPNQEQTYANYALLLTQLERYDEALQIIEKESLIPFKLQLKAIINHHIGQTSKSNLATEQLIAKHQENWSYQIAGIFAVTKEKEKMYYWLEKALEYNDFGLIELPIEPIFKPYRNEPRFTNFMEKVGYIY